MRISAGDIHPLATFPGFLCACGALWWKRIANLSIMARFQRFAPRAHIRLEVLWRFRGFMLPLTHFIETWQLRGGRSRLWRRRVYFFRFVIPQCPVGFLQARSLPDRGLQRNDC
jgi:hypothetical protein